MKKEQVIKRMAKLIEEKAEQLGLTVTNNGTGHAFDHSFWNGLIEDDSNIPNIVAKKEGYSIKMRSFWGDPELDLRRETADGEELLIFRYSDSVKNADTGHYDHTGDFRVHEVRVDARWGYVDCITEVYKMIETIEHPGWA